MLQFIPWRAWAWESLQAGHLPLWNPLVGMGAPLLANYQSAFFYPPNWFLFLLTAAGGPERLAWGQGWLAAAHLAWAAFGMGALARRMGLDTLSQTVAGLAFGLSGYLVARAGFLSINAAVAWLPWILLGLTGRKLNDRNTLFLALSIGMLLLAGHAQTAWYILLLAAFWSGFWAWRNAEPGSPDNPEKLSQAKFPDFVRGKARWVARSWGTLALATGLGACLAAVQLLPTAEYLLQSQRAGAVDYEAAMTYSFWPWRILGLLAPGMYGSPASGDYWGYGNYWEDAIYIGLLPFLLAVRALLHRRAQRKNAGGPREKKREMAGLPGFLSALILVSFLLALGSNLPLFPWFYQNAPTFDMFQSPARFTIWAVFALALAAGIGAQFWWRPAGRALYWTRLGTMAALAVALGAGLTAFAAPYGLGEIKPTAVKAFALAGMWGIGIGFLTLAAPERDSSGTSRRENGGWTYKVVGLLVADLVVAGWGLNPAVEASAFRTDFSKDAQVERLDRSGRIYLPSADEEQIKFKRFLRFDTFSPGESWENLPATLLPDTNMLAGIASANNFDPLVPGRYARWMETFAAAPIPVRERLLDLMAVTAVERVGSGEPLGVRYETRSSLPRLRWVACGVAAGSPEEALEGVQSSSADIVKEVILEGIPSSEIAPCPDNARPASASLQIVDENPDHLSVDLENKKEGYLVLADVWYPGWEAWVDGKPEPLLQANYLFRAVHVLPGEHRVEVAYGPKSIFLGALLSGLAWTGIVLTTLLPLDRRRLLLKISM